MIHLEGVKGRAKGKLIIGGSNDRRAQRQQPKTIQGKTSCADVLRLNREDHPIGDTGTKECAITAEANIE